MPALEHCSVRAFFCALVYSPRMLSPDDEQRAIDLALEGKTLQQVADALGISTSKFYNLRVANPEFAARFTRAREEATDVLVDRLVTICDDFPDVNQARLMSDNFKWIASKRKPLTYGDRIDVNVTTVSLGNALMEARRRAGLIRDVGPATPPQLASVAANSPHCTAGSEPVAGSGPAAGPAPGGHSGGGDAVPIPLKSPLAGPITRRNEPAATLAAPPSPRRVIGPYNAKNAAVSRPTRPSDLTDDPEVAEILS
jgi:hypothetical protein